MYCQVLHTLVELQKSGQKPSKSCPFLCAIPHKGLLRSQLCGLPVFGGLQPDPGHQYKERGWGQVLPLWGLGGCVCPYSPGTHTGWGLRGCPAAGMKKDC